MFCATCGNTIETSNKFCSKCGSVSQATPPATPPAVPSVIPTVPASVAGSPIANSPSLAGVTMFQFHGSGLSFLWLVIWTSFISMITLGLFFPWAYSLQQCWIASNTYIGGRRLAFIGTGMGFLGTWLLIFLLTVITLGIYSPWAYCRLKKWEMENTVFADEYNL